MFVRKTLATALLLVAIANGSPVRRGTDADLLIDTSSGPVQGFVNATTPEVRQFLGIPYAEPPLGDLRFAPPQNKSANGTIQATAFPPSCMQQTSTTATIYTAYETQFLINGGTSEDCLYLSVWTPSAQKIQSLQVPLPVFVYIPGGGFTSGGQNSLYKIPDQWIQRTQTHIVVVMNYRVNIFGYPNSGALSDLNPGLLDQRQAVEWVYDNIAAFGGDPERIILWGQSAGGASVDLFSYAYPDNPIVAGFIADSGAATIITDHDVQHTNFTFLAGKVGCGGLSSSDELACMRKVDARTLEQTLSNYTSSGVKPAIAFTPIVDEKTVFSNTTARALSGQIAKKPMIIGSNTNEGAGFVPYTPDGPGAAVLFNLTQSIIACPVALEAYNRDLAGLSTYRYQYTGNFSNISPVSWFGAYHSSELPLLFGTHYEYRGNSTEFEWQVSAAMEAFWLSFAENPSGGPVWLNGSEVVSWPLFEKSTTTMQLFAEGDVIAQTVSSSRIDNFCPNL